MRNYSEDTARPRSAALTIFAVGGLFLLGLGLFLAHEKRVEVDARRAEHAAELVRLEKLEEDRDALEEWRDALENDPVAVEAAIRRKLHWVRPDERVLGWDVAGETGESAGSDSVE